MKITKKALAGNRCTFGFGWVSNGHYAVRLSQVENAGIFAGEPATAAAALGIAEGEVDTFGDAGSVDRILAAVDRSEPFTVSPLTHGEAPRYGCKSTPLETRLAFSAAGAVLALDRSYCALLGIEPGMILWARPDSAAFLGASPHSTERPAVDDIAAVLMPVRFPGFAAALGEMPAASALSQGEESPADTLAALARGRAAIAAEKAGELRRSA